MWDEFLHFKFQKEENNFMFSRNQAIRYILRAEMYLQQFFNHGLC